MSAEIHPTAIIGEGVQLGPRCRIGPYVIIESGAVLGADNELGAGCYMFSGVRLGDRNRFVRATSLGGPPQHQTYKGEPTTVEVGNDNWFGENVTVHRGTVATGRTVIGNGNYFMAGTHVAHDCVFGDRVVMANNSMVAGEAQVGSRANLGGGAGIHQRTRVGELAMVGAMTVVLQDVLPFTMVAGEGALYGLNRVGIRRAGMPLEHLGLLRRAYREFCVRRQPLADVRALLEAESLNPFAQAWLAFTESPSKRGYLRAPPRRRGTRSGDGAIDGPDEADSSRLE